MAVKFELTPEDYEDGVAELLTLKFQGSGTVERNVMLPSRSGGRDRQIDILVRIPLADIGEALMIVDCKRYGTKVDVKDVEAFIGMVEDVGAPIGLLVTTEGYTKGAVARAAAGRDIRIDVIRVEDLPGWEPPLVVCELCREAIGDDALLGMAYVDIKAAVATEDGDEVVVTLGYCEKCGGLHVECPRCETLNAISDWQTGEWVECEGGCGSVEFYLRREATKDDLSSPTHDRLTIRLTD